MDPYFFKIFFSMNRFVSELGWGGGGGCSEKHTEKLLAAVQLCRICDCLLLLFR